MRHMEEKTFCSVCQEGLWTNLLRRLVQLLVRESELITASNRIDQLDPP